MVVVGEQGAPFFGVFVHEGLQNMTHVSGKGGWCIGESKSYDSGDEQSSWGFERHFPLVLFLNADVVVSPSNIKL